MSLRYVDANAAQAVAFLATGGLRAPAPNSSLACRPGWTGPGRAELRWPRAVRPEQRVFVPNSSVPDSVRGSDPDQNREAVRSSRPFAVRASARRRLHEVREGEKR